MPPPVAPRPLAARAIQGRLMAEAALAAASGAVRGAWRASPLHRLVIGWPPPLGVAVRPRDLRPPDPVTGYHKLEGHWSFFGEVVDLPKGADPWDRPSPSRRHAAALHSFSWAGDMAATGEAGLDELLRLMLEWRRAFGQWNPFAWSGQVLERRVFNWACALPLVAARGSQAEVAGLVLDLARQARSLLGDDAQGRRAEQACAAALAGCSLAGPSGEALVKRGLRWMERELPRAVLPDGGHASRSPERALELLLDLITLDDALAQLGQPPPEELPRAIDRMFLAVRMLTLRDGRLAPFQGGSESQAARVAAALSMDDGVGRRPASLPDSGYHRLEARDLEVLVDAGRPASGAFSLAALAQPLAVEVLAGGRRLITQVGWTEDAAAPVALRMADGGSTVSLGETSAGAPARGFVAEALGPRLLGAPRTVQVARSENPNGVWLDAGHDGWLFSLGLWCERRLFLSAEGELRGEDRFRPAVRGDPSGPRRYVAYTVRFHLHPDVSALVARDKRSVLLRIGSGSMSGWRLHNDAADVEMEPSWHYRNGVAARTQQIVLRGQVRPDIGGRVRWKLSRGSMAQSDAQTTWDD
jgi:uncharacterized heparinase superfamily protein